jgi:dTDP-4-dehydrorhamnose 3,5-epimerase-like enzyme
MPVDSRLKAFSIRQLYIPQGIAHGCRRLENEIGISRRMSTSFRPDSFWI